MPSHGNQDLNTSLYPTTAALSMYQQSPTHDKFASLEDTTEDKARDFPMQPSGRTSKLRTQPKPGT